MAKKTPGEWRRNPHGWRLQATSSNGLHLGKHKGSGWVSTANRQSMPPALGEAQRIAGSACRRTRGCLRRKHPTGTREYGSPRWRGGNRPGRPPRRALRNTGLAARLLANGLAKVKTLQILGGADIVEGFETGDDVLEPGTVVVIDERNPGELRASARAYDSRVAGVVSGANGVAPGLRLGQEHVMDGETSVAMTGRVYVRCSVQNGRIRPGDLLTTSDHAGHAMRASSAERSNGAVLGKAMTSLDAGTGLVLVLVNLQ